MPRDEESSAPTRHICEFVLATEFDDLSEEVVDLTTRMVVDTVGVALAATSTDTVGTAERALETASPESHVVGGFRTSSVRDAGLMNGILAHALDFDDVHHSMGGHPTAPVLSAALPVAARRSISGSELLTALVLGTEVEITLAKVLNPGHYERGWHPTSVLGTFGAVTAAGSVLGLDLAELRNAFGIAASSASGIKGNFGTMTKPYHVGNAARSGLEAAQLASRGFTANERILELGFGGFLDLFQGDSGIEYDNHFETLGSPWSILQPRTSFKPYPCCGSTHAAVDAALSLRHEIDPDSIAAVEIAAHPRRLEHTDRHAPETGLEAKFSIQYCVSTALLDGDLWIDHFSREAVRREDVRTLQERVTVRKDEEGFATDEWGARVVVETDDSERVTATIAAPRGSGANPLSDAEFERKYRRCASRALDDEQVETSLERLQGIETAADVSRIANALVPQ